VPGLDDDLLVRGFVAAGSDEEARPDTYVYPAGMRPAGGLAPGGA